MNYKFIVTDDKGVEIYNHSTNAIDLLEEAIGKFERHQKYDDGQGREYDILDEELEDEKF